MNILIDGYNLIFACGFNGAQASPIAIERSRRRLIEEIVRLMTQRDRLRTTIVFDAQKLPANESDIRSKKQDIDVIFSVGYPDADTLIEELIANHSHPKSLLVVSSDHRIQTAATRRRAVAIDSGVWFDRLEKGLPYQGGPRDSKTKAVKRPESLGSAKLDSEQKAAWMEVFAEGLEDLDLDFDPAKPFANLKSPSGRTKQSKSAKGRSEPAEEAESLDAPKASSELEDPIESDFEKTMSQFDPELIELMNEVGEMLETDDGVGEKDEDDERGLD